MPLFYSNLVHESGEGVSEDKEQSKPILLPKTSDSQPQAYAAGGRRKFLPWSED